METSTRVGIDASESADGPLMPYRKPLRTWAGHGTGATCDGCGESIRPQEIEYEIELPVKGEERSNGAERPMQLQTGSERKSLRFHFSCYRNWTRR